MQIKDKLDPLERKLALFVGTSWSQGVREISTNAGISKKHVRFQGNLQSYRTSKETVTVVWDNVWSEFFACVACLFPSYKIK